MSTKQVAPATGEAPMPTTRARRQTLTGIPAHRSRNRMGRTAKAVLMGRWDGITRPYSEADVERLRGTVRVAHTIARMGALRLWDLLTKQEYVAALGALTGNQAVQQVKAGLQAIYLSGWQVAADANLSGQPYPDQTPNPATGVPTAALA